MPNETDVELRDQLRARGEWPFPELPEGLRSASDVLADLRQTRIEINTERLAASLYRSMPSAQGFYELPE